MTGTGDEGLLARCAEGCGSCAAACEEALEANGRPTAETVVDLLAVGACMDVARATAQAIARRHEISRGMAHWCEEVCRDCAGQPRQILQWPQVEAACLQCAELCRQVVQSGAAQP